MRADWLADSDVRMPERSYERLVRVWREAVIRRKLDPPALARLDPFKVEIVLAAVDRGSARLPDALSDAEALGWRQLRRKYARAMPPHGSEPKGLPAPDQPSATPETAEARATQEVSRALAPAGRAVERGARGKSEPDPQLERWLALYNEVRHAADTGQPVSRANASVIVPGLDALAHLLGAEGVSGIDRLMP